MAWRSMGGVPEIWTTPPRVGCISFYIPPPQRDQFQGCGKMGRLDRAMRHCRLSEEGSRYEGDGSARPSWDMRAVNARPDQFGARSKIDNYTAHELLNSLRGLSVVLVDIALTIAAEREGRGDDVVSDNEVDLRYVADKIQVLCVVLEERVRTRNADEYNDKRPKDRRGSRGKGS